MVLALEADDRDGELKMKRERFACEGATDSGIKLFGCRIRASPEYRFPAKSGGGDRVPADYGVALECTDIIDVGNGEARHAHCSSVVRVKREVASGEDVKKIHPDFREAEATDHEEAKDFKKPDKIRPCPRCNSLETKFCYFNNYNVNQPRHFCRNCQRYWTAGGTMRNVPVGAGRRKNKQFPFPFCQMVTSPTPESTPVVLKFASETSMSESVETVLAVGDQNMSAENKEESASCRSSMTTHGVRSHSHKDGTQFERFGQPSICTNDDSFRSSGCGSVPACFVPLNLNQLWNNNAASLGAHYAAGPMLGVPGFNPQTIPLQIVASPYLGCISFETASQGNVAPTGLRNGSSPNCSVLGKHPRDASFDCKDTENTIYAPRALKVDNLTHRSSLHAWTTVLCSKPE